MTLSEEEIASVVQHMNDDHSDTLCNYVRYFGGVHDVVSAELKNLTKNEMHIQVVAHSLSCMLSLPLTRTIEKASDARTVMVEMAKQARIGLAEESNSDSST